MADEGRIARIKPGTEPRLIYAAPGSTERVMDWQMGPGSSMRNYDEYMRPLRPGERMNLQDDEGARALKDAMRLRMQLPR